MANTLDSNVTRKLARVFLQAFDAERVITKSVNTQLLDGKFNPSSGATVDFKRPHDYTSYRDATGDLTSYTKPFIESGKATGTVQPYFTVSTEWNGLEEAIQLDQLDQILAPAATRICQDLETDFAKYMAENSGSSYAASGTYGTSVATWRDIADAGAYLKNLGVPTDKQWCYVTNPTTSAVLAGITNSLASGSASLVDNAWQKAELSKNFAGFRVMESTHLHTVAVETMADVSAAITATTPTLTYAGAKDSMTQVWNIDGLGTQSHAANTLAGQVVTISTTTGDVYELSLATRNPIQPARAFTAVIVSNTAFTSGAGTITVAKPAIFEANGAYNTVDAAIVENDVIDFLGTSATSYQPNMMYHPDAFSIGSVKLPKLYSTDTVATTKDGLSLRVSKYSDGDTNKQKVRFDLLPAYATLNPHFASQAWG